MQTCGTSKEIIPEELLTDVKLETKKNHSTEEISTNNILIGNKLTVFFRLFRLGVLESFLLIFGIFGSILFGVTNTCFGLQSIPQLSAIFSRNNYHYEQEVALKEYIVFLSICGILYVMSVIFQIAFLGMLGPIVQKKLRYKMFSSLMSQEMSFFDNPSNSVGSLCLHLSLDAENVKNALCSYIGVMLNVLAQLVTSIICVFVMSWQFGFVQLATFLCGLSACIALHTLVHKKEKETTALLQESNEVLRQSIMNIRTVVSLGLQNTFQSKLLGCYSKTYERKWSTHIIAMLNVFVETTAYAGLILDSIIAVPVLLQGKLVILLVFRAMILLLRNNNTVRSVAAIPKYIAANNSMKRIFTIIDSRIVHKTEESSILNSATIMTDESYIEFKNVEFSYPKRRDEIILNQFNLKVKRGQMIALVGESGSGKSTCIELLEQFYKPDIGSVMISEISISDIGISARQQMALVPQEPSLFNRTIFENIAYGINNTTDISMEKVIEAAKIASAHDFITKFPNGYNTCVGDRGIQISGGQKQRIAIARALLRKSDILLLDEATSALDTETEKNLQECLQLSERDRTLIIVAHRLSTIRDADVIFVVNKGKVVEAGTHSELIALQGNYYKLHKSIAYSV